MLVLYDELSGRSCQERSFFFRGSVPKVTDSYREERRREIAAAALRCFGRKGFQGTSMADIIAESGLSAGAIYGNFKNKDDLIDVSVHGVLDRLLKWIDPIGSSDPILEPHEFLAAFLRNIRQDIVTDGLLLQVWAEAVTDPDLRPMVAETLTEIKAVFASYLTHWYTQTRGLPTEAASEKADKYAPVLLGTCQGFLVQSAIVPDFNTEGYLAGLSMIAL
ncbi:TetR/AcrR family transcriptional regulator [Arthrobacter cryoconiti]|uniref:TetR/AcrR family transcriptional regulator n=2 Tax=Arthrobacter cryoconiti TaxID=748907 RepID=A0ABV8QZK6_9MICC|nr:TetR/AcrR family transcriptional regulator [Arthrobacter cryoconiti]